MKSLLIELFFALGVSFIITTGFVPVVIFFAYRYNILDIPDGKLKAHKQSTPYLGGVAVAGGFFMTFWFCGFSIGTAPTISLLLLLGLGLIDDCFPLKPWQKLLGQVIAVAYLLLQGIFLSDGLYGVVISLFWAIAVINSYNLVDVMDGLATTLAWCASVSLLIIFYSSGETEILPILVSFIGALSAFFLFNRPPAKIYLGDAGALFIGGFTAFLPLLIIGKDSGSSVIPVVVAGTVVAIPALEIVTLVIVRWYRRIPFYNGSPDHFACYLQNKGWTKNEILFYMVFLSCILLGLSLPLVLGLFRTELFFFLGANFVAFWYFILLR